MSDDEIATLVGGISATLALLATFPIFWRLRSGNAAMRRNERRRRRLQETDGEPLRRLLHRSSLPDMAFRMSFLIAVVILGLFVIGWSEAFSSVTWYGWAWWFITPVVWSGYLIASFRLVADRNRPQPIALHCLLRQAMRRDRSGRGGPAILPAAGSVLDASVDLSPATGGPAVVGAMPARTSASLDSAWQAPLGRVALGTADELAGELVLIVRAEFVPEWDVWMTGPGNRRRRWMRDAGRGRVFGDAGLTEFLTRCAVVWLTPEEDAELERRYFDVRRTYLAYRGPDYGPRRWWQIWRAKGLEYQGSWPLGRP